MKLLIFNCGMWLSLKTNNQNEYHVYSLSVIGIGDVRIFETFSALRESFLVTSGSHFYKQVTFNLLMNEQHNRINNC